MNSHRSIIEEGRYHLSRWSAPENNHHHHQLRSVSTKDTKMSRKAKPAPGAAPKKIWRSCIKPGQDLQECMKSPTARMFIHMK